MFSMSATWWSWSRGEAVAAPSSWGDVLDVPRSLCRSMVASFSVTSLMQLLAVVAVSRVDRRRTTSSLLYWGPPDSPCNR